MPLVAWPSHLSSEAAESGNKRLSTVGAMLGFILMMSMDVGLG